MSMAFDQRSEDNISSLVPRAQAHARRFLQRALDAGFQVKIISGTRTYAQQNALYAQGRTKPGPRVTNARAGQSNHNFGIAWDIGLFNGSKYLADSPQYALIGKIGRDLGLEWGGDWHSIQDQPHFQIKTGRSVSQLNAIVQCHGGDITKPAARDAVDALVPPLPDHPDNPAPTPQLAEPEIVPVEVFYGAKQFTIEAYLVESRTWVSVADFTDYFGGTVTSNTKTETAVTLNGENRLMQNLYFGGRPFVKFADINALLGYGFSYDGKKKRLTLFKP